MLRVVGVGVALGIGALCGCGGDHGGDIVGGPVPTQLVPVGGDKQAAFTGHLVPLPLAVMVKNSDGSTAYDVTVDWAVTTGGGMLSASSAHTDDGGVASVTWTLGNALGAQSVTATARGLNIPSVTFSATGRPLPISLQNTGSGWNLDLVDTSNAGAVLTSMWGLPSNIFAVGNCRGTPLIMRFVGSSWTVPPPACANTPPGGSFVDTYTSVWGNSASDVFAVHQSAQAMINRSAIDHFDGQSWVQTYTRSCSFCGMAVRAVWTGAAGSAIAVGDSGTILRYDGASWNPEVSGTFAHFRAIWGAGASGPVFAVGDGGTIVFNNGNGWVAQTSGTTQPLYAVWGMSGNDVFAVGGEGTILHYDGTSWTPQSSGSTKSLRGLWGSSPSAVYAVGDGTTILHYDGSSWTAQIPNPTTNPSLDLTGVWGSSASNITAVGQPR